MKFAENKILHGDCLDILPRLPSQFAGFSLDPPILKCDSLESIPVTGVTQGYDA